MLTTTRGRTIGDAMADRFVTRTAQGFDVIEGVMLNSEPLTRGEADRLAREPVATANAPEAPSPPPQTAPPVTNVTGEPQPAVDLRAEPWLSAGGSAGFRIKASPGW
jgi:hypothetical protein